jgi:Tfp pilus assembly protein FimT
MKNNRFIIKQESGFSMIELLTIIAIVFILTMIAIPNFMVWKANYRFRNAMADLYSSLQETRMLAMKDRMTYTMTFNQEIDGETYDYVVFKDNNRNRIYDAGDELNLPLRGNSTKTIMVKLSDYVNVELDGVSIIKNGNNQESVSFLTNGMRMSPAISSDPGVIRLRNTKTGVIRQVNISRAGRLSISNV